MTRIISGDAGGTRLDVPPSGTRPTSDRVRESLFGALETTGMLDDTAVLDLYAGSGALGLEALSRGAATADLVEKGQKAAQIVRGNAARVQKATGREARTHAVAVQVFLRSTARTYDLVFIDPPYDLPPDQLAADLALVATVLASDGLVIVERAQRSGSPDWGAAGLVAYRDKSYGDTALWWGELP
ncbi:16S rRNA (guanine(966)-N(2))-methyltransferase RsmD [Microbacterium amylolyticum]|uniref:16S rRNA (Guanine966-N2)-methyltransferase n=1 Tax=Microbacterium amylolyticum TaxID=936337 RepID=A0ABS4ZF09_9MICO|nr:16S rRNA (guanine(966)-N(2))-methyltransferase RsmD [Microbacterium amylolyticum]MBP2435849.1 16S rRNA (guanine966-N2)-methyltransferase [Microbacterium amylolyticum]